MKKIVFVLFIMFLSSCEKDEMSVNDGFIPINGEIEKSKEVWETYKKSVNNSYSYINYTVSFAGYFGETKIIVENGKVTGRVFKSGVYIFKSNTNPEPNVKESWVENSSNLNTHTNGAESLTLDEIYQKANNEWLRMDTQKNDLYFTIDVNGFIASCGYVPKGCQDDCFFGVHIKSITSL